MKPTLLVLAAGIGSRYGGLKQIEPVGPNGEVVLDYSVYDALRAGFGRIVFVIRRDIEESFQRSVAGKYVRRVEVRTAFQELEGLPSPFSAPRGRVKPWGTGHALLAAERDIDGPFAVINADDFYGAGAFEAMESYLERRSTDSTDYAMVGFTLRDTLSEHGHVARGLCECDNEGRLVRIVERTKIVKRGDGAELVGEKATRRVLTGDEVVSMNFWGFTPSLFPHLHEQFETFLRHRAAEPTAEFYIPAVVDRLIATRVATVRVLRARATWYGITYQGDKPRLVEGIRKLLRQGVYPERLW